MAILKKISIIYFFIWIVIPKDAILFFVSVPAHFSHHLLEHGQVSLLSFIDEHIQGTESHPSDEHAHERKFPCDHHHSESCGYSIQLLKMVSSAYHWSFLNYQIVKHIIPFNIYFPNEPRFSIWQPPQQETLFSFRIV